MFVCSIRTYWDSLSAEEKESAQVAQQLNSWCRYFAVLSQCNLDERIAIAREDRERVVAEVVQGSPMSTFVLCLLHALEVVTATAATMENSTSVADVLDLSLYSQVDLSKLSPLEFLGLFLQTPLTLLYID